MKKNKIDWKFFLAIISIILTLTLSPSKSEYKHSKNITNASPCSHSMFHEVSFWIETNSTISTFWNKNLR